MSIKLSAWHELVRQSCTSAPVPTVNRMIRSAIIEFCERTLCWRDKFVTSITPAFAYTLTIPAFSVIHSIETAWVDDIELTPAKWSDFSPDQRTSEGQPRWITQVGMDQISIFPRCTGIARIDAFLKPQIIGTAESLQVPEFLLEHYGQAIADGALGRILAIPDQTWTNPPIATFHATRFQQAIDRNMSISLRGQHGARLRARPQFL